jgi:hypothetical protein
MFISMYGHRSDMNEYILSLLADNIALSFYTMIFVPFAIYFQWTWEIRSKRLRLMKVPVKKDKY